MLGYHGDMAANAYRKSPVVLVRMFIALQFAAAALYYLAAIVADYKELWVASPIGPYLSFEPAQFILIFVAEALLISYSFVLWYRTTLRLSGGRFILEEGVLRRNHREVPLNRVASVSYNQSIIGRLANYGTVQLCDTAGGTLVRLGSMSDPRDVVEQITGFLSVADVHPRDLVQSREHARLERKSTLRWDLKSASINRSLERAAMKTVAAFLNSGGGHLIVGIGDDGSAVGLHHDFETLQRKDEDGWENHFNNLLAASIGPGFRPYVQVRHFTHDGKACAAITVAASPRPAYMTDEGREEFFVRTGNGTTALKVSEAHQFITSRFGGRAN
ncbi:MAG TPA: RNA-binding domain-containing protein [Candidatus Paceibacterota bacterium]|nr:RNA-binding domain-containing protein [Candidatus Paceibacterota bacterium]